jgi:hypothetical protein
MTTAQTSSRPVDIRLVLSAHWAVMVLVFAYVDIFAFYRPDVIEGTLAGTVPGVEIEIGQGFLVAALGYILPPILMVVASLVLDRRILRPVTLVLGVFYAVSIAGLCIGESWAYYLVGSAFEVVLLASLVWRAWRWPSSD